MEENQVTSDNDVVETICDNAKGNENIVEDAVSVVNISDDEMQTEIIDKVDEGVITIEKCNEGLTEKVVSLITELSEKMDVMNSLFIQKIQHSIHEEKIVDQMHAELQRYKDDMYSQLVRPILLDVIEIRDSILRMSKTYAAKAPEEQLVPLKLFSDYAYDVQDILEKNNISIYEGNEGDTFNPIKQRAVKKIKTPVEELHGKIADSLSCGYDYMGKTVSPEKVVVYFYEKPENEKGENQ